MKQQIKDFLNGKEKANLKEIYSAFADNKKDSLRGIINLMVKNSELQRVGRGEYSLPSGEVK